MYKAELEYNGKVMIFPCDRDPQIFVNIPDRQFEDGEKVTAQDVLELLTFYGHDIIRKPRDRKYKERVYFYDDDNNLILFDSNGDPIVRVEDGKIHSASYDCICDKTFPMSGNKQDPDMFREEVESSGLFTKGKKKRKLYGCETDYTCKTCGNIWTLEQDTVSVSWAVKSRYEQRG